MRTGKCCLRERIFGLLILMGLAIASCYSQPIFYSQSLQKLYNTLPTACRPEHPVADTVVLCTEVMPDITVPVAYCWDSYEVLAHMGYRFLQDSMDTLFHPAVIRFLERELLMLIATDNLEQKLIINRDNGLILLLNGATPQQSFYRSKNGLPFLLQHVSGIKIGYEDEKKYHIDLICEQNQILSFYFVADAELLSDMDKKERDILIAAQLSHHRAKPQTSLQNVLPCNESLMQKYRDSAFICKGNVFIIPQINNDLYYRKNESAFQLVFSKNWIAETFSNVMLAATERKYTAQITQRVYGDEQHQYELNSLDFFDYFSDNHERYFGIESIEKDILTGTLIFADKNISSIHIAFVSISLWDLLNGGTMKIQLDANIPQHNIQTIFGRNKNEKTNY